MSRSCGGRRDDLEGRAVERVDLQGRYVEACQGAQVHGDRRCPASVGAAGERAYSALAAEKVVEGSMTRDLYLDFLKHDIVCAILCFLLLVY